MLDNYGRKIEYLRLSVTDRCDLNCVYCKPKSSVHISTVPDAEALLNICRAAAELGIKRVRITGGEPLTRRDCPYLVKAIKAIDGIDGVYITTNGTHLESYAKELAKSGVDGINISLDSADREEYRLITGHDRLDLVNRGIDTAYNLGISLKLNSVCTDNISEKTLEGLIRYPADRPIDLRFIELMPIGGGKTGKPISNADIFERLNRTLKLERCEFKSCGPSVYYSSPELKGKIGFISAMSHSFCADCNRLRVTSDGILKPCLCYGSDISLKGIEDKPEQLKAAFLRAVEIKPISHCFNSKTGITENHTMDMIGG